MDALVQIVDDHDIPLYGASKQEAIDKHLNRRIVRIMLEDATGNILLQKRAPTKQPYPNRWDNSVAGHVDEGETYDQAAHREIYEEIGLQNVELQEIDSFYVHDADEGELHAFIKAYKARIDTTPTKLGAREVSEVRWFTPEEIRIMIDERPQEVTDGLKRVFDRHYRTPNAEAG